MCYGRSCSGCYHSGSCDEQDSRDYDEDNPYIRRDGENDYISRDDDEDDYDGWGGRR